MQVWTDPDRSGNANGTSSSKREVPFDEGDGASGLLPGAHETGDLHHRRNQRSSHHTIVAVTGCRGV